MSGHEEDAATRGHDADISMSGGTAAGPPVSLEPPYDAWDRSGMGRLIEGVPGQIRAALAGTAPWSPPVRPPALLAVGAMGGSAIAADLTAALYRDRLPQPLLVVRDYAFPACVGPGSLALLSSYSGNTEETLALAADARARSIPWRALTTGGPLAEAALRDGAELRGLPGGMPPRAATYASWVAMTRLVAALGWIEDPDHAWGEAATALDARVAEWGFGCPEATNPAKALARGVGERMVFLLAAQRLEPVGTRWRNQVNENAKLLAHSAVVPELNHNEVVGWEKPGNIASRVAVIVLRDGFESAPHEARLALTAEYLRRQGVPVFEPDPPAGGPLARLTSLVLLGDYVSFYLAIQNGVDPTPIRSLDEFKRRLSEWWGARAGKPA